MLLKLELLVFYGKAMEALFWFLNQTASISYLTDDFNVDFLIK
jgi:hypothetical protein